jgi:hypothetical protein
MKASLEQIAEEYGYDSVIEMIHEYVFDSVIPACCTEGCEVEPDGKCCHGHPSILIVAGFA